MTPTRVTAAVLLLAGLTSTVAAQTARDTAGIRTAAQDYIEGWYTADAARMERALHPELAKRNVSADERGRARLTQMSAMTLVQKTREGAGPSDTPPDKRTSQIKILDIYEGAAVVRVNAATWVDFMHLARWNGRWVIVNVLWENTPQGR
jgi:hypothetical protein